MSVRTQRMADIEALLADDPKDAFLRYGLAMEYSSAGDDATSVRLLKELLADEVYIPAFLMAAQGLIRLGNDAEAAEILRRGTVEARAHGDLHALGELQGLLTTLE